MEESKSGIYIVLVMAIAMLCLSLFMNVGLWGHVKLQKNTIGVMEVELQSTRNIAILRTQETARATGQYDNLVKQIRATQKAQQEARQAEQEARQAEQKAQEKTRQLPAPPGN